MTAATSADDPEARAWSFRGRIGPPAGDRERAEHLATLASELRVGHGASVGFEWVLRSGPDGSLSFRVSDTRAARWWQRVIARHGWTGAYQPIQRVSVRRPTGTEWVGRVALSWPAPLRSTAEGESILDVMAGQFRLLPSGIELRWRFRVSPVTSLGVGRGSIDGPTPAAEGRSRVTRPVHRPEPVIDRSPAWESYLSVRSVIGVGEREHLRRVARAIASATRSSNGNFVRCRPARPWGAADRSGFPTSEREVALIFPTRDPGFARLDEGRSDRCFAVGREATGIVVGPRIEPDQGRHMAILGETGMGKSSLLIALSRQASRWGGLLLLDPLGETAEAVRETLGGRLGERLVTVDPVGPHALNALASLGPATSAAPIRRERQLNELVAALRRVRSGRYVDSGFWGPRLEEILTRALDAAASLPGGTLATAHSLLEAEGRGFRHVPADAMDAVRALGERIRARPEDADGARRLLFEVTRSPTLSRMLCSASPDLTAADLVRPGRVVLVSGLAEVVGETCARYLTAVILALAWSELLARPELSKTCVVLDEAQWFAHDSLAEMLRLGRRRNVHVILATQALGSLPDSVADAVRTNVADFVLYRGSPEEAREASRTAPSLVASSLLALPRGKAVVLLGKGASVHWVRTARAPPADVPWPTRPSPGSAEDPGPAGIGPDLPAIDRGLVAVDQVLGEIRRMAEGSPDRGPIRVSLEHLRRSVDREGSGVRRAGSELRRSGAIVGSGRDDHGAYWRIDAGRLGLGGGDGGGTRAPATPAQGPESSPAAPSAGEEPRDP